MWQHIATFNVGAGGTPSVGITGLQLTSYRDIQVIATLAVEGASSRALEFFFNGSTKLGDYSWHNWFTILSTTSVGEDNSDFSALTAIIVRPASSGFLSYLNLYIPNRDTVGNHPMKATINTWRSQGLHNFTFIDTDNPALTIQDITIRVLNQSVNFAEGSRFSFYGREV